MSSWSVKKIAKAISLSVLLVFALEGCRKKGPPVFGEAPAFKLTDQTGNVFDSKSLQGNVWIANFIFTRCKSFCPRVTSEMVVLQRSLRGVYPAVKFISFSIDPDNDTPEILSQYAKDNRADTRSWSFLTTKNKSVIHDIVVKGFKLGIQEKVDDIVHSGKFVVIDKNNRIRGFFPAETSAQQQEIKKIATFLTQKR